MNQTATRRICRWFVYAVMCAALASVECIMVKAGMPWWYIPAGCAALVVLTVACSIGFEW